jgi:hypothetical protein
MSTDTISGVSALLKTVVGTEPAASAAGTVTGAAIDRTGFTRMALYGRAGAVTGAPTSFTVDAKVQHCDTVGGTYVDWKPAGTAASGAITTLVAASTDSKKSISLVGAKQFLKVVTVTAFVGGTSPTMGNSVTAILGGSDTLPAQADY